MGNPISFTKTSFIHNFWHCAVEVSTCCLDYVEALPLSCACIIKTLCEWVGGTPGARGYAFLCISARKFLGEILSTDCITRM